MGVKNIHTYIQTEPYKKDQKQTIHYPSGYCTLFKDLSNLQEAFSEPEPCQSCSTKFGNVLNVSMLSPEVLTTMHILLMRHSGIQKEIFNLLVTTIW